MSRQQQDMSRRIPNNLGGTETIWDNAPIVGAVELTDGIIAFGPAFFLLFLMEGILPPSMKLVGFLVSGLATVAGAAALLAKPSYMTLGEWISDIREYRNTPGTYRKAVPSGKTDVEGLESIEVNSEQDTRTKIDIERIYPQYGAIERPDESLVGIVRIRGLNLDAAPQQTIARKVQQFDNLVNQNLNHDVQLYMPMRQYDPTSQIDMYENRLEDSRVFQNDPLLQEYISDRISFLTAMSMGSYIRRFYLVCEVTKREVVTQEAQAGKRKRLIEQLIPGALGEFASNLYVAISGGRTLLNDEEMKVRQLDKLEERRAELASHFSGLGCKTEELNADEVGVLLKEFWEGVHISEDEEDGFIRSDPYVKGDTDRERLEQTDIDEVDKEFETQSE